DAVRKVSGFRLAAPLVSGAFWIELPEQWDPKSPWADQRVRLAASHAIDRAAINQAEMLGFGRLTGNFVPRIFQFAVAMEPHAYDPAKAKKLLAEAGYPNGFDAGDFYPFPPYDSMGEAILGSFQAVGRHQESPAHDGARGVLHRLARQEAPRRHPRDHGGLRQRGHAARALRHQERRLRLRIIARDRRPVHPSGARARCEEARGPGPPDPADHPRQGDGDPTLRAGVHLGRRAARGGGRRWPHPRLRVLGAVRGSSSEGGTMMDSTFTLEKKTAIVVGAANGIGRATALAFAAAGARVACADVEEPGAKATAAEIEKSGAHALPVHLDVTDGASCRAAVAATVERFGGLDVLMYGAADRDTTATVLE